MILLLLLLIASITSTMTKTDSIRFDHHRRSNSNNDKFVSVELQDLTYSLMFVYCTTEAVTDHLLVTDAHKIL